MSIMQILCHILQYSGGSRYVAQFETLIRAVRMFGPLPQVFSALSSCSAIVSFIFRPVP